MLEEMSRAAGGQPFVPLFAFRSCGRRHERRAGRMTIRFTDGDGIPDDVMGFTEKLFRLAVADVETAMEAILAGEGMLPRSGERIRDLAKVGLMLVEERAKVEKLRKQVAGDVGTGSELDLDAARDEIGRRLACLRAARGD